jgi:hypothetical protein
MRVGYQTSEVSGETQERTWKKTEFSLVRIFRLPGLEIYLARERLEFLAYLDKSRRGFSDRLFSPLEVSAM